MLTPDGTEVNVPALGKWADDRSDADRQRAEEINEALAIHMIHHDGNRGSAFTQQGIDVTIQACLDALNRHPDLAGKISHQAGGHDDRGEPATEEYLSNYDANGNPVRKGSHLSDFTFKYVGRVIEYLRGNTVDTKEGGALPSGREQRAGEGIKRLANDEYFFTLGKWPVGTPVETMQKDARIVCGAVAEEFAAHIRKKEEALPPDHVPPTKYPGPSSAREAEKRRTELKLNVK